MACLSVILLVTACSGDQPAPPRPAAQRAGTCTGLARLVQRTRRGYYPGRSPDILPIPREPNYIGTAGLPVHTGPWDYLANVPLVVYGPGVVRDVSVAKPATMADVAPTIAGLVGFHGFDAPDGNDLSSKLLEAGVDTPKLVVTIVWDGSGDDMLAAHDGKWPFLKRLTRVGAAFSHMTIGSTPSNTPAIHTTLGTGAFPDRHGVVHVKIRTKSGGYVDPFAGNDARRVLVPSLADIYDKALANRPKIAMLATVDWHLGMIGHGAEWPGGDRDLAALVDSSGRTYGNTSAYSIPALGNPGALGEEARALDAADGARDGRWLGHALDEPDVRVDSPAWVRYQQSLFDELVSEYGLGDDSTPDLLFENFKSADAAGHRFGMTSPEVGADIAAMDGALRRTVGALNRSVGRGRWVLLVTADHGFTPYPKQSGAWPISGRSLKDDLNAAFDDDGGVELVFRVTSPGIYVHRGEMRSNGVSGDDIARWLIDYTVADNASSPPATWRDRGDERLFEAALVGTRVAATACD